MTLDHDALRVKYREERDKRLRRDGNDQYLVPAGRFASMLDDPYTARIEREPRFDDVTVALIGGGFSGLCVRRAAEAGRHRRRVDHRGRGRLRRRVVLEPLPGRDVRHRGDDLHAVARRDGPHAVREVRHGTRDLRALPAHRQDVRPLRQRALLHRGHRARVGCRRGALDHPHRPRRRDPRPVRGHGYGPAQPAQAARHPRNRDLRGPLLPHEPLGLRVHRRRLGRRADDEPGRQARRHHRDRRDRRAVHPTVGT